jgi:hypothetical protein
MIMNFSWWEFESRHPLSISVYYHLSRIKKNGKNSITDALACYKCEVWCGDTCIELILFFI